jgi:hypothetical protein
MTRLDGTIEPFALKVIEDLCMHRSIDINQKNNQGSTALHIAATNYLSRDFLQLLIDNGADREAVDNDGFTPLDRLMTNLYNEPSLNSLQFKIDRALKCIKTFIKPSDTVETLSAITKQFMQITVCRMTSKMTFPLFSKLCCEQPELIANCLLRPFKLKQLNGNFTAPTNALLVSLKYLCNAHAGNKADEQVVFTNFVKKFLSLATSKQWLCTLSGYAAAECAAIIWGAPRGIDLDVSMDPLVNKSGDIVELKDWQQEDLFGQEAERANPFISLINTVTATFGAYCVVS